MPERQLHDDDYAIHLVQITIDKDPITRRSFLMVEDVISVNAVYADVDLKVKLLDTGPGWGKANESDPWRDIIGCLFAPRWMVDPEHTTINPNHREASARIRFAQRSDPLGSSGQTPGSPETSCRVTQTTEGYRVSRWGTKSYGPTTEQVSYEGWLDRDARPLRVAIHGKVYGVAYGPFIVDLDLIALPVLMWLGK